MKIRKFYKIVVQLTKRTFLVIIILIPFFCRHVGDLGNVEEVDGMVYATLTDSVISLNGTSNSYIIGRAVVVSVKVDVSVWCEQLSVDPETLRVHISS